jgi:hypothetical protein
MAWTLQPKLKHPVMAAQWVRVQPVRAQSVVAHLAGPMPLLAAAQLEQQS